VIEKGEEHEAREMRGKEIETSTKPVRQAGGDKLGSSDYMQKDGKGISPWYNPVLRTHVHKLG
jgi:hypothetical protein